MLGQCCRTVLLKGGKHSFLQNNRKTLILKNFEVRNYSYRNSSTSWISLRGVFTRWTPCGVILYGGYLWNKGITEDVTQIELEFYTHLPLRIVSKIFGKFANIEVPVDYRPWAYGKYTKWFGVNIEEAITDDFTQYKSLATFFARNLKPGARNINLDGPLVSPCDGKILSSGPVTCCKVEQVKGVTYSLQQFFGQNTWTRKAIISNSVQKNAFASSNTVLMEGVYESRNADLLRECYENNKDKQSDDEKYYRSILSDPDKNTLHHCVIYLAPGDYHRFHSPCDWIVKFRRHFSGKLLSVNPLFAKLIPGLFCLNERAVYIGDWKHGFFSYTAVGATNVGSIQIYKDNALHTNGRKSRRCDELILEPNVDFERGEIVGQFNMGSTIVLIFEAPKDFEFYLKAGDTIKMGSELGNFKNPSSGRSRWF